MADDERENSTTTLAQQIFGKATAFARRNPPESKTTDASEIEVTSIVVQHSQTTEGLPPAAANLGPSAVEAQTTDASEIKVTSVIVRHSAPIDSSPPAAANLEPSAAEGEQKQLKTAVELAEMIETDLARHPDCPKVGFRVTVYGWPYWQAMLTITPAAGGVRNPQEWRALTTELAERLRKRYDVA